MSKLTVEESFSAACPVVRSSPYDKGYVKGVINTFETCANTCGDKGQLELADMFRDEANRIRRENGIEEYYYVKTRIFR